MIHRRHGMTASRRRQEQHWNSVSAHTENHIVSQHTNNPNSPPNIKHHPPRHTTAQRMVCECRVRGTGLCVGLGRCRALLGVAWSGLLAL